MIIIRKTIEEKIENHKPRVTDLETPRLIYALDS